MARSPHLALSVLLCSALSNMRHAKLSFAAAPLAVWLSGSVISPVYAESVQAIPVSVEAAKESSFANVVKEVGKIDAIDSAILTFNAGEKISAIHFKNGDKVTQGQVIAELDNAKAKANLDKAESTLALAKTKLERIEELLAKEPYALSKQDVDELKENVNLADADLRQNAAMMKDYVIKAPFDGQLTSFSQSVGSQISAGTELVTIFSLNPVEVRYAISQQDLGKAAQGQKVAVTVEAYANEVFHGVVNYVAPAVDESSGRVEIHAALDNPDFKLAPGMFASITQYFSKGIKRLLVPQNSVIANNDKRFVWVVKGNKAIQQEVSLGKNTNKGYVVITKGLKVGDLVVKTGMQNLKVDSLVDIIDNPPVAKAAAEKGSK